MPRLEQGIDVLLDIDVQGAEQVMARCPEAHGIFVLPPSYEDLERRLRPPGPRRRRDDRPASRRLPQEIKRYDRYHYVIINDDARRASEVLAAIILEKRHRRERMHGRVQEILRTSRTGAPPLRSE